MFYHSTFTLVSCALSLYFCAGRVGLVWFGSLLGEGLGKRGVGMGRVGKGRKGLGRLRRVKCQ